MEKTNAGKSYRSYIPVMLTPFNAQGKIDFDALSTLIEMYLDAGAGGLFANCLSSEMFQLDEFEKLVLISHVVRQVAGRVPVVAAGNFGETIPEQAAFICQVHAAGADAVILINGLIAAEDESDEVFEQRVFELVRLTPGVPLGFYECPVPYKRLLNPAMLGRFAATGRFTYHKDTCLDINGIREKLAATKLTPLRLYDAYMVHAVESLRAGATGLSCIQGNYWPELMVWICNNFDNESAKDELNLVQQFLVDNMEVMHHRYPQVAKYYLFKKGILNSLYTRNDKEKLTPELKKNIDILYDNYEQLAVKIGLHNGVESGQ